MAANKVIITLFAAFDAPTPPMAANKVIITLFAAFDASDAAHGCEQGDYHPLCSLRCLRRRPWLRTR
jgi:hypothetical protein